MRSFKHLLCAVDFSPEARHAAHEAALLAGEHGGTLELLHVVHLSLAAVFPADSRGYAAVEEEARADAETRLGAWAADLTPLAGGTVSARAVTGLPWVEIVEEAERIGADLVVAGSHGRDGLERAWLGSVAERVVQHAPCPVLVVKTNKEDPCVANT